MTVRTQARNVDVSLVEANGAKLHVERRGGGPATILFIPGGLVDSTHFAAVAELLAADFTVVTYDRRGNAGSPRPSGWTSTTIGEQADDAAGLIQALQLEPAAVWGGSLGGLVVLDLVARWPELVRIGIVHEPPLLSVLDDGDQAIARLQDLTGRAAQPHALRAVAEAHARQVLGDGFGRLAPELRERMFANAATFFTIEVPGLVRSLPDPALLARALQQAQVRVEVMAAPGNRDDPVYRTSRWIADHVGVQVRELPGGHMPYAIQPEPLAKEIASLVHSTPAWEGGRRGSPSKVQPPRAEQHTSQTVVVVHSYQVKQISPPTEGGMSLVSTLLKERFTGDLNGSGVAEHVRVVRPDGSDTFWGVERFVGSLAGRRGAFLLTASGATADGIVHGHWEVVPGSATGELAGLRGRSVFSVAPSSRPGEVARAHDSFTYWFEPDSAPQGRHKRDESSL
jgi:pimeloyl-ACP methyl ester carboxylesterase